MLEQWEANAFSPISLIYGVLLMANVLSIMVSVGVGRLLITRSIMNNITGRTNTRTEPGYKLNCTRICMVDVARD